MFHQVLRKAMLAATLVLGMGSVAQAATVNFNTYQSGVNLGATTLATLSATEVGDDVVFVLTNTTVGQPESFITRLLLTYTGSLANITLDDISGVTTDGDKFDVASTITDAGLQFQIDIQWLTSNKNNGVLRLEPGEFSSFSLLNTTLAGFFTGEDFAMIHVQGLGQNGQGSTKYVATTAVPLPAGLPLLLAGLGALALVRRRKA